MREQVDELRRRAARLERAADDLRAEALRLAGRECVPWRSHEASRWRAELTDLRADLRREADGLDDAAAALRRHADEVERTLDRIDSLQSWFGDRLADARRVLSAGAEAVGEAATDAARAVVDAARHAPAPGSPGWLHFWGVRL